MRIIAGEFKSRIIKSPKGHRTHPMSEKIRGALFNSLGDISGKSFLDAYAGSGSVAIEALSRGAIGVHAVDISNRAYEILQANRDLITNDSRLKVHRANTKTWLKNVDRYFDIIVADPPYDNVSLSALEVVATYLTPGGIFIVSLPHAEHFSMNGLEKLDEKRYGNAKLVFYKKSK